MRSFVAIELPESIRNRLGALNGRLREFRVRASWVQPANMHLTLRFLGEINDEQVGRIKGLLAQGYRAMAGFSLHVRGTGAFPNMRKPSVIWVGVGPLEGPLAQVQQIAENAARAIGLPPEEKAFHPHVTLARIKDARGAGPLMDQLAQDQALEGGEFWVASVALFSSQLTRSGAVYSRIEEFRFDSDLIGRSAAQALEQRVDLLHDDDPSAVARPVD